MPKVIFTEGEFIVVVITDEIVEFGALLFDLIGDEGVLLLLKGQDSGVQFFLLYSGDKGFEQLHIFIGFVFSIVLIHDFNYNFPEF